MEPRIDNGLFHQNLKDLKVLVIVPHEDDEINTCGALLKAFSDCMADITLAFTTNGDWKYPAQIRMKEAVESAALLGIPENNIIFLGYGDSVNNDLHDHIFYTTECPAKSTAGHTETYGTGAYSDFSYQETGKHSLYTKKNYLEDIISLIKKIKADLIICTDFDEHPDHRMLSLSFDRAIGMIRKDCPEYCPEVWKRFAYSLAYTSVPDYCAVNNPETKRPVPGTKKRSVLDLIDRSIYNWDERIRIPVPFTEGEDLRSNLISKALQKHKSQLIITHADRIINSDEIFWKRRTDSISYAAEVTVSSGDGSFLNDFLLYNVEDIDAYVPPFVNYYWKPETDDPESKAVFKWKTPQTIEQLVLYGSLGSGLQKTEIEICFDTGYSLTGEVPCDGKPVVIDIDCQKNVRSCELRMKSCDGSDCGISECEFYSSRKTESKTASFCKITSNDNFIYEYIIDEETKRVPLSVYLYGVDDSRYRFDILEGNSKIIGNDLDVDPSDKTIVIKCSGDDENVWDQIVIKRLSKQEMALREKNIDADKAFLKKQRDHLKVNNMIYIMKHQGPVAVGKRTLKNVIMPKLRK